MAISNAGVAHWASRLLLSPPGTPRGALTDGPSLVAWPEINLEMLTQSVRLIPYCAVMGDETAQPGEAATAAPWHPALNVLWAKTDRSPVGATVTHPLTCHLLDVAAVSKALWKGVLPEKTRRTLRHALCQEDEDAGRTVSFLAAMHDFGKASPAFQLQESVRKSLPNIRALLTDAGLECPPVPGTTKHGQITAYLLGAHLEVAGAPRSLATKLAGVLGGHHGIFANTNEALDPDSRGRLSWRTARSALYSAVEATMGGLPRLDRARDLTDGEAIVLAGIVCVADWIGSNTDFFPYETPYPSSPRGLMEYRGRALGRASDALRQLGWIHRPAMRPARIFRDLFPEITTPYPIQSLVAASVPLAKGPVLMIVEAPMGEGKTEAAMYAAEALAADQGYEGFYFALPTQATSNQMLSRVRDFVEATFPDETVQLQLLHGKRELQPEFLQLRQEFSPSVLAATESLRHPIGSVADDEPELCGSVVAAEWFSRRKKGLLSPYAVGTVDQALLASLPVRHFFVRLLGLSQKVVVIDEVHAYDTYMTELMERLLEWLATVGASVVLLSATLPRSRSAKLLQAFRKGLGKSSALPLANVRYPRVGVATSDGVDQHSADAAPRSHATIKIEWLGSRKEEVSEFLTAALRNGGCAAVICNTVRSAQERYLALKREALALPAEDRPAISLFHARFPFEERQLRECEALWQFGKADAHVAFPEGAARTVTRPYRAILVATQVIEQSLDLDFDVMVTELAPIDLVLQRSGRLHRHQRARPAKVVTPRLAIIAPEDRGDGTLAFGASTYVYAEHILLRSWLMLTALDALQVRDLDRLIEAVYEKNEPPPHLGEGTLAQWNASLTRMKDEQADDAASASGRMLPMPDSGRLLYEFTSRPQEEDDPSIHPAHQALTRLAEPQVSVVPLWEREGNCYISPGEGQPIDLEQEPFGDLALRLLKREVSITSKAVVFPLWKEAGPRGWRKSPWLRHHRVLRFDANGQTRVGTTIVELSPELGIRITRIEENAA